MSAMHRLRLYHIILAPVVLLAYFSSEWERVHSWLGYGVALVILIRLTMAAMGLPQLGLERFYPHFTGLDLGRITTHPAISRTILLAIAISLISVTATGLIMDKGRTLTGATLSGASIEPQPATVVERRDGRDDDDDHKRRGKHEEEGPLSEVHEFFGNLLLLLVGGHVAYLLAFKRPLARFMLFLPPQGK